MEEKAAAFRVAACGEAGWTQAEVLFAAEDIATSKTPEGGRGQSQKRSTILWVLLTAKKCERRCAGGERCRDGGGEAAGGERPDFSSRDV